MLTLWENTAATVAQHAEFPGAARAFMAQPRVSFALLPSHASLSLSRPTGRAVPSRETAAADRPASLRISEAGSRETNDARRSLLPFALKNVLQAKTS